VLFIIADDLSCDLGCYGNTIVQTPSLDRLASTSVRFDRAYVQYPLCSPSRSSFLTGLKPESIGVFNNNQSFRKNRPEVVTLPQLFRQHGVFTAAFGKIFHHGALQEKSMQDPQSWDLHPEIKGNSRGSQGESRDLLPLRSFLAFKWIAANGDDEDQLDGRIAGEAIKFLEKKGDQPFFLAVGFHRPHVPLQCPRKYFDLYPLESLELPKNLPESFPPSAIPDEAGSDGFASWSDQDRKEFMRGYFACITFMDAQVGKVLDALERLHLDENTIVVFTGDHGYQLGQHGWWSKNTLFEETLRTPLLIRLPGAKGNGKACNGLVEHLDLYPTIADLCGLPPPSGLDGMSLRPLLEDPSRSGRESARSMVRRGEEVKGRSIRTDRWRYTEWNEGALGVELYDFKNGPAKGIDRTKDPEYSTTRAELSGLLRGTVKTGDVGGEANHFVEVSQPLVADSGMIVGNVAFPFGEDPADHPELEVSLTVKPSPVAASKDESGHVTMQNAASLARLQLRFPPGEVDSSGKRLTGVFGDTLVVVMDLSETLSNKGLEDSLGTQSSESMMSDAHLNQVIEKTVECLLLNARRRWPRIRHLALSIDGSHHHENWEGVHSLEKVGTAGPSDAAGGSGASKE
jgi:uncharacterized sulfatase